MKRKLISYDAFERIEKDSLSNAQRELVEAENLLSKILDKGELSLHCFGESNVLYETEKGTFIRANYHLDGGHVFLEDIEEVVIDEDSHRNAGKEIIHEMLECILDKEDAKANNLFGDYMQLAEMSLKMRKTKYRGLKGGRKDKDASDKVSSNMKNNKLNEASKVQVTKKTSKTKDPKRVMAAKKGHRGDAARRAVETRKRTKNLAKQRPGEYLAGLGKVKSTRDKGSRITRRITPNEYKKKKMNETAIHVLQYIDYVDNSPIMRESFVEKDNEGNISSIKIPTLKLQNEAKLLSLKWDTLKTDVKVIREHALRLSEDANFCKLVSELKRYNNISDDDSLSETLKRIALDYPSVLYLTQEELSHTINNALEFAGVRNYDDQTCSFMAEGILSVAFDVHPEKVNKIKSLAKINLPEGSMEFQVALQDFFQNLDEQIATERNMFEDLREVALDIRSESDPQTREEAEYYIDAIDSVLDEGSLDLDLASEVADWVNTLIETNLETKNWDVVKTPYRTTVGEHPQMQKWANWKYDPADDFSGDYGAELPAVSDDGGSYKGGKGAKSMASSWSTKYSGGPNTYPALSNPYVPKPFGDYTMKGETGVDKDSDGIVSHQSKDTWPNLSNPYIPQDVRVHVNSDNRVDDVESKVGLSQTSDLEQKIHS